MEFYKMSVWQVFLSGGPVMWPILLCSIFAFSIILEKYLYLRKIKINSEEFLGKILEKVKRNQIKEALEECESTKNPIAHILKGGILKYDRPRPQIKEAIEDASLYEIPKLEKNMGMLATIANISPLLGLLGTIAGLIKCLQVIQVKSGLYQTVSPADLAFGMREALLAAAAGLIVAIPAFIAYNYLLSRINNFILEMEKASTELVNFLTE